ncbi:hypothetical protein ACJIZ3_013752 [Penstemon smallii]|uniref:Uncharacterized protein n=1 Tax=Penstemon smallii TaxID=265156 RepID=A0ABD3RHI3_9LAMI
MAHEAVVSLNLIIESFLNIGYPYTHPHPILRNAELIHEEVWSLKSILELNHFEESERLNSTTIQGPLSLLPLYSFFSLNTHIVCTLYMGKSYYIFRVIYMYVHIINNN